MDTILHCPAIAALSAQERAELVARSSERRLEAREALVLSGDPGTRLYLLLQGLLKLSFDDSDGRPVLLALAVSGDLIGLLPALDGEPHQLDVIAASPARVLGFDARILMDAARRSPRVGEAIALSVAAQTRWITAGAIDRAAGMAGQRLAGRLLDLGELMGRMSKGTIEIDLPLAQADLGALAGLARETTCKHMTRLRRAGVVDYGKRGLRILRPDVLEKMRCGNVRPVARRAP